MGTLVKETLTFLDDDIARFMEEASARRGREPPPPPATRPATTRRAFRVLGRYMDEQKPRDVFFFEQDGAFVVRLLHGRPGRQPPRARRVHPRRHRRAGRARARSLRYPETPERRADHRRSLTAAEEVPT